MLIAGEFFFQIILAKNTVATVITAVEASITIILTPTNDIYAATASTTIKLPLYDRCGLLMRKDHPLARKNSIRPEDIGDFPIWIAHQQLEENSLSGWLGRDLSTLCFVPLTPPVKAELYLVWKKYEMFTKAAETFLKHIQQNIFDIS